MAGVGALFAAIAVRSSMQIKKMEKRLAFIGEKCCYMEKRMDAGAAKVSDVCRHLQQMFEEFDEDVNEGRTVEAKWWWVQRRIRSVFEDFCCSATMLRMDFTQVKAVWSLLQMEVKLRVCRDIVASRYYEQNDEETAALEHCMKNMVKASNYSEFWRPMTVGAFEMYEATSGLEEILVSQVKERIAELQDYMMETTKSKLMEGLPLEGIRADSM